MSKQDHYKKLENLYTKVNIGEFYDTTQMTVSQKHAEISLEIEPKYHMGLGLTHGSVYFRLLDDACFYACMSLEDETHLLTSRFNIEFLKPVISGKVIAKGKITHELKRGYHAESALYNSQGEMVAYGSGYFAKTKMLLSNIEAYKL